MSHIHCYEFLTLLQAQRKHLLQYERGNLHPVHANTGLCKPRPAVPGSALNAASEESDAVAPLHGSQQLQEIEMALARIANGSYGLCTACSGEIDRTRLKAEPAANHCIPCSRRENGYTASLNYPETPP